MLFKKAHDAQRLTMSLPGQPKGCVCSGQLSELVCGSASNSTEQCVLEAGWIWWVKSWVGVGTGGQVGFELGARETGRVRWWGKEKGRARRGRQKEPKSERLRGNLASRPLEFEGWVRETPVPINPTPRPIPETLLRDDSLAARPVMSWQQERPWSASKKDFQEQGGGVLRSRVRGSHGPGGFGGSWLHPVHGQTGSSCGPLAPRAPGPCGH